MFPNTLGLLHILSNKKRHFNNKRDTNITCRNILPSVDVKVTCNSTDTDASNSRQRPLEDRRVRPDCTQAQWPNNASVGQQRWGGWFVGRIHANAKMTFTAVTLCTSVCLKSDIIRDKQRHLKNRGYKIRYLRSWHYTPCLPCKQELLAFNDK